MLLLLSKSKRVFASTIATALMLLAALEVRFPYYFLQDDGLEYYLPCYIHNWRSLTHGELPLYNFHTFAGVPHASMGQPGVFYVPQYIALLLSQLIWHHPFAVLDFLGIMNGLLAVAGGYLLLRQLGASDEASAFGGLTALSGVFLWFGRMWFTTTMLCAWFPWMVWASLRYVAKPHWDRALWVVAARIALLYVGHSQYFVLAMVFEHAFALIWLLTSRSEGWHSRCAKFLALDVPTVALGAPFFLPLAVEVRRSLLRSSPLSYQAFSAVSSNPVAWIFGQLLVFVDWPRLRQAPGIFTRSIPFLSYVGYAPTLLLPGVVSLWRKQSHWRPFIMAGFACFIVALLWSWNIGGPLIYHLPVFNRFRFPFKLIYFAGFFQCLLAALVFARLNKRTQYVLLGVLILNWAWVFLMLPNHAWRIRKYHPPLQSPWTSLIGDGRYFVISDNPVFVPPGTSGSDEYVELNYSLLWGLDNLLGYEPMHSRLGGAIALGNIHTGVYEGPVAGLSMDHLRRWSVKYVLLSPTKSIFVPKLAAGGFEERATRNGWTLWEDSHALPRIRWESPSYDDRPGRGIEWTEHVNSIDVNLAQWPASRLTFAFAANPALQVCIERVCEPIPSSADGSIHIDVPTGTKHLRIVYRNGLFLPSICIALLTLVLISVLLLRARRRTREMSIESDCVIA